MDNRRLLLLAIFGFSLLMLWESWQQQVPAPAVVASSVPQPVLPINGVRCLPRRCRALPHPPQVRFHSNRLPS